jgi:uncharacterized membrane protein
VSLPPSLTLITRILVGWNVAVWSYLVFVGVLMARASHAQVRRIASQEERSAVAVLAILSVASVVSIAAIVVELVMSRNAPPDQRILHYLFTGATILGSWLLLGVIFTFHYAYMYFAVPDGTCPLRFPDNPKEPDYWDFLYFSFTIAVAAQTSDVTVLTSTMRKVVVAQSILSFFFNATILGFSINIAAGLIGT